VRDRSREETFAEAMIARAGVSRQGVQSTTNRLFSILTHGAHSNSSSSALAWIVSCRADVATALLAVLVHGRHETIHARALPR